MSIMRVLLVGGVFTAIFDLASNHFSGITSAYHANITVYFTHDSLIVGAINTLEYTRIGVNYNP